MKRLLLLFILICVVALMAAAVPSMVAAADGISYVAELVVSNTEGGYQYGNNDVYVQCNTLQGVFDDIAAKASAAVVVRFDVGFQTAESITFNYPIRFTLLGSVTCTSTSEFIKVASGELRIYGLEVTANASVLKVQNGATASIEGGVLTTVSNKYANTVVNNGTLNMTDGEIYYNTTSTSISGNALYQSGDSSILQIDAGRIEGNSAFGIGAGTATINGGFFRATCNSINNTENGCALRIINNGNVVLNGGVFRSVDGDRAVMLLGNNASSMQWTDGTVGGRILFANNAPQSGTVLSLVDHYVYAHSNADVYLYATEGDMTLSNARMGIESVTTGYYLDSWSNTDAEVNALVSDIPAEHVRAVMSNVYDITMHVGADTYVVSRYYGTQLNLDECVDAPLGYTIVGWQNAENQAVDNPITVNAHLTYTAQLEIAGFVIAVGQDIAAVYDGATRYVNATVDEIEGLSYSFQWKRQSDAATRDGAALSVINVSDSGIWYPVVTASDGVLQKVQDGTSAVSIDISKAQYTGTYSHDGFEGTYSATQTLADFALSAGYFWQDEDIVPTVPVQQYTACYCPDTVNYQPYLFEVSVVLSKANAYGSHSMIDGGQYVPNRTLADYSLGSSAWRWKDPTMTVSAGMIEKPAVYNPDEDNYNDFNTAVMLYISKAYYAAEDVPEACISARYRSNLTAGSALSSAFGMSAFRFADDATYSIVMTALGEYSYPAIYNADTNNYYDFDTTIYITVGKGIMAASLSTISIVYQEGMSLSLSSIQLPVYWRWLEDTMLVVGRKAYSAAYNRDSALYDDYETTVTVELLEGSIDPQSVSHPAVSTVYHSGLVLGDLDLQEHYQWQQPDTFLYAGTNVFLATYKASQYYQEVELYITVEVFQAQYDVSGVTFADATVPYDGNEHTLTYEGALPQGVTVGYVGKYLYSQAGEYTITIGFTVEDINYLPLEMRSATLTISPIECPTQGFLFVDTEVTYNGEEQTIAYSGTLPQGVSVSYVGEHSFVTAGKYTVEIAFDTGSNYLPLANRTAVLTIKKADYDMSAFVWEDTTLTYSGSKLSVEYSGTLPKGVRVKGYTNQGHTVVGTYLITISFEQDDTTNYNKLSDRSIILRIVKAPSPIMGTTDQVFLYDGQPHRPNVTVTTPEQDLTCDNDKEYIMPGTYEYHYSTAESINYLAGTKKVYLHIQRVEKSATSGNTQGSISNERHGIADDAELSIELTEPSDDNNSLDLTITLSGVDEDIAEEYFLSIDIPAYLNNNILSLSRVDAEGNIVQIEFEVQNGKLVFTTTKLGSFIIQTKEEIIVPQTFPDWIGAIIVVVVSAGLITMGWLMLEREEKRHDSDEEVDA